jgi:hypothetical protein
MNNNYEFFFVRELSNGSLFVGPKFSTIAESEEKELLMKLAHEALGEEGIDVSRLLIDDDFGELSFFVNNRIEDAKIILQEIDEEF